MTNLQAIDLLKGLEQSLDDYCELSDEGKTAFGMAITALELFGNSEQLPSAQPERLTDDDFETIRIHLNAYKEKLCNQHRWEEADEYQRIIDRFMAFASAQPDLSEYSDKLWKAAYERGKAEAHDEIVCCEDCKNRGDDDCPMRFIEWVEYDDDGYIEHDDIIHDYTKDDGFCDRAERRTDE